MKIAQLVAEAVSVVCPSCGADQPSPGDGSMFWTSEDFLKINDSAYKCVSCEERIMISKQSKVRFD